MKVHSPLKILQIIPADGWVADYRDDGDGRDITLPVTCFALVEIVKAGHPYQEVRPMGPVEGGVEFCEDTSNFKSIRHISLGGG